MKKFFIGYSPNLRKRVTYCWICYLKNCKPENFPYILWIHATRHNQYRFDNRRKLFNEALVSVGKEFNNNFTLELKQLWNPTEKMLFNKDGQKHTAYGLRTFWKSIDRTIKFCVSIIERITAKRTMARINGNNRTEQPSDNNRGGHHHHHHRRPYNNCRRVVFK